MWLPETPLASLARADQKIVDRADKWISLAGLAVAIEIVLFKFLPDLSTALIQGGQSTLSHFGAFERMYLTPGSVHHARFLGNEILHGLARSLEGMYRASDPRLHPLRVAAGILTPVYAYLGAHLVLWNGSRLAWRYFLSLYALMVLIGLYVFYPADMPALASVSAALFFLLEERLLAVLVMMVITGLFRETSFHVVWLVAVWAWCDQSRSWRERLLWLGAFTLVFVVEYVVIRRFFPGPVSSSGGVLLDPGAVFLDKELLSLTTICSVGLAVLFPLACLLRVGQIPASDWRGAFFKLNCYAFPAWLIFYRMLSGNLSEFRMLWPVLIPCIYGIAYAAAAPQVQPQSGT